MDASTIGMIAFAAVLIMLALRVPIAFTLASVATVATFFIFVVNFVFRHHFFIFIFHNLHYFVYAELLTKKIIFNVNFGRTLLNFSAN